MLYANIRNRTMVFFGDRDGQLNRQIFSFLGAYRKGGVIGDFLPPVKVSPNMR